MASNDPKPRRKVGRKTSSTPKDSGGIAGRETPETPKAPKSLREIIVEASRLLESAEVIGQAMHKWFVDNGGYAYLVADEELQLSWKGEVLQIGHDSFKSFLLKEAGITTRTPKAGRMIEAFRLSAIDGAQKVVRRSWYKFDRDSHTLFLHLNAKDGLIFRVSPAGISRLQNGLNEDKVLLFASPKTDEWEYRDQNNKEFQEAVELFAKRVLTPLACSENNRLLYGCWTLGYPLIGFTTSRPHLRCEGSSGRGKTRAMDLISTYVYGRSRIKTATDAANYLDASQNPLLLIDNIESKNLTRELIHFLLTAVSVSEREKRKVGSVRGVTVEELHCLLNTSGIENLDRTELLNRTIHIEFDHKKYGQRVWTDSFYFGIISSRSEMMSAHIHVVQRVLKAMANDRHLFWRNWLKENHDGHFLERSNEYLVVMALVAEEIVPIVSPEIKVQDLVSSWIVEQTKYVGAVAVEANPIVAVIDAVFREAQAHSKDAAAGRWQYELPVVNNRISGSSSQLLSMLSKIAGKYRLKFDYPSANTFSRRLRDAEPTLINAGFELVTAYDGNKKHFKFTISKKSADNTKQAIWSASTLEDTIPKRARKKKPK